jgi:regulator of RNase E activity RraA
VADGRLRDFAEVRDLGLAAWCSGETVRQGGDVLMPFAANVPVSLAGATVLPGDWVMADASGVVVIPAPDVGEVLAEAARLEMRDAEIVRQTRAEDEERLRGLAAQRMSD